MRWLKKNLLAVVVLSLGLASLSLFTYTERGYFCDQAKSHHEKCGPFFGAEHVHDWLYNASSNWQSELLFGVLLVTVLNRAEGPEGDDET